MSEFEKLKIVTEYEFLKHLRRRRLYAVVGIVIAVELSVLMGLPLLGEGYPADPTTMAAMLSLGSYIALIGVVFFAGDSIAGEFEGKTGYILLPTPVRRTSIVAGKYLACYSAIALIILLGYGITCASLLWIYGRIPSETATSFALCLLFAGSVLSLTFLFSSMLKGAMGATVMTLAFVFIISATLEFVLMMAGQPSWFLLSRAGDSIVMVYPGASALFAGMAHELPAGALEYDIGLCAVGMVVYLAACIPLSIWITKRREMV